MQNVNVDLGDCASVVNASTMLLHSRQFDLAFDVVQKGLKFHPGNVDLLNNRGLVYKGTRNLSKALVDLKKVLHRRPNAETWTDVADVLHLMKKYREALFYYGKALELKPDYPPLLDRVAVCHGEFGRFDLAIELLERAHRLDPESRSIRYDLGMAYLTVGRLKEGFTLYGSRRQHIEEKRWHGEDLHGKTIMLHTEQGYGDVLMMLRYVPLLAERGAKIILRIQKALKRLVEQQNYPGVVRVAGGLDEKVADYEFDYHALVMDLPHFFGTELDTIPVGGPYIVSHDTKAFKGEGLKVGIAWQGSRAHPDDHKRSIDPTLLRSLLSIRGVKFYGLQVGELMPKGVADLRLDLGDFVDTATAVSRMDLVISVDTSTAHLAAAMGKPVWLLLAHVGDFRWLTGRNDSPWYPTVSIFRQRERGEWRPVIEAVRRELEVKAA